MIFTQQKRREMNKKMKAMYPDIKFTEHSPSIPVMECDELPSDATIITDVDRFIQSLHQKTKRTNEAGITFTDFKKALPVFIRSMELNGNDIRYYYRVNYVTPTDASIVQAIKYIREGILYLPNRLDVIN